MASLNRFLVVRDWLVAAKKAYYVTIWGMDLHESCSFSLSARFDRTHPRGVHVDADSFVAFDAAILTHDRTRRMYSHTRIGKRCFIGARSIVMPGVQIGDGCIVGAGSVVTRDVPSGCIVAGNPARIVRRDIQVGRFGQLRAEPSDSAISNPEGDR